ncbi:MAG TPA: hypothetical protein VGQ12_17910 [Candidatus Angelobacter sp.]|nr:hypothetical protein [Candidatus Angelobacter sp.]
MALSESLEAKTDRILRIAAEYGLPEQGKSRGSMLPDSFSIVIVGKEHVATHGSRKG